MSPMKLIGCFLMILSLKLKDFVPEEIKFLKKKRIRNNLIFVLYINTFLIFILFNGFIAHLLEKIIN